MTDRTRQLLFLAWGLGLLLLVLFGGSLYAWALFTGQTVLPMQVQNGLINFIGLLLLGAGQYINHQLTKREIDRRLGVTEDKLRNGTGDAIAQKVVEQIAAVPGGQRAYDPPAIVDGLQPPADRIEPGHPALIDRPREETHP